jgi:hypothetical protein
LTEKKVQKDSERSKKKKNDICFIDDIYVVSESEQGWHGWAMAHPKSKGN